MRKLIIVILSALALTLCPSVANSDEAYAPVLVDAPFGFYEETLFTCKSGWEYLLDLQYDDSRVVVTVESKSQKTRYEKSRITKAGTYLIRASTLDSHMFYPDSLDGWTTVRKTDDGYATEVTTKVVVKFGPKPRCKNGSKVCTNICVKATKPKSKRVKREARRLHHTGWTYVGRVSRPARSTEDIHVVKSHVRPRTWHVFKIRRTAVSGKRR